MTRSGLSRSVSGRVKSAVRTVVYQPIVDAAPYTTYPLNTAVRRGLRLPVSQQPTSRSLRLYFERGV